MTSISSSAATAEVRAAPKVKARNLSLDRARTFLTLVVLLHHSVIPYTYFGHTDPKSWIGFDMIVLATDSFFMAMFFFLSGLFVWPGITRKGPLNYLSDRLLRLGLPFVICALTIIPIAYYAISLRHHPEVGFSEFWWTTITKGPWPDRKSTRLNSSHSSISYAVFCLKKKKKTIIVYILTQKKKNKIQKKYN